MTNRCVVFKCSFGGEDGWGHVIRSSSVAESFKNSGWRTILWTESNEMQLPVEVRSVFSKVCDDIWSTTECSESSVLFIDEMYTPDSIFQNLAYRWRSLGNCRIVVGIDDMRKRSMGAFDISINSELGLKTCSYQSRLSLLGENFAMLRKGFQSAKNGLDTDSMTYPVFVMLGGTDAFGYTNRVLQELKKWRPEITPVVAYGGTNSSRNEIMDTLSEFATYRFIENAGSEELASWMGYCRFGIIACGTSLYEAAAKQMPFIGLSLVDNQSATADQVTKLWGMPVVRREESHEKDLNLKSELELVDRFEKKTYSDVDGLGATRINQSIQNLLAEL